MLKRISILLFLAALTMSACQASSPESTSLVPSPSREVSATPGIVSTIPGTTEPGGSDAPPGCTVISPEPTPGPTEQSLFSPVSDADWSFGPKDAQITLLEYSDFQ
jgi:hypothetical protein